MSASQDLKRAQRAVAAFFFVLGFGGANWLPHVPMVRHRLGLNDLQLGFLLLSGGIGAMVAFRNARFFMHRFALRTLILAGSCGAGVMLCIPVATGLPWLAAAGLFCAGYCNGLVDVSINACAVDVERRLGKPILSSMHGYCSLGGFAGASCGALATSLDLAAPLHMGLIAAVVALVSITFERAMLRVQDTAEAAPEGRATYTAPLVLLGCVAFCSSVGEGAMAQWTAVYLHDELHTSAGLAGVGYACYSGAMVTGRLLGDRVAGRWPARAVFTRCGLLVACCLAIGLATRHAGLMIAGGMGVGLGLSLIIPTVFRCAVRLPNLSSAAALSSVATLSYGGFLFGPPVIGFLAEALSLRIALGVVAALAAVMGIVGNKVAGRLDRPSCSSKLPEVPQPLR